MATNEPNNTERTEAEFRQYADAWTAKMIEIWQDRLDLMAVHDTGALRRSVVQDNVHIDGLSMEVSFSFLQYGVYVDRGTGRGVRNGNRKARPWFSRSWYISSEVLKEHMAKVLGNRFVAAFWALVR